MSSKNSSLHAEDDPLTDVDFTGSSINFIDFDDEPTTDVDMTGTSLSHIDLEDDPLTDIESTGTSVSYMDEHYNDDAFRSMDAQSEGIDSDACYIAPLSSSYDPLETLETGDADDTGICLHYIDTDDDPTSEVNFTGASVMHMEDDDLDDEYTTDVDVTGRGIENLIK